MNTFLITYQIFPPSLSLQEEIIINQIRSFNAWARPTGAVWLIKTYYSREFVMDQLKSVAGPNDRLLVMRVSNDWIALHLPTDVINWMKSGL